MNLKIYNIYNLHPTIYIFAYEPNIRAYMYQGVQCTFIMPVQRTELKLPSEERVAILFYPLHNILV